MGIVSKTNVLIAVMSSTLIIYMIFPSTSIGFERHFLRSSLVQTSYNTIEAKVELPLITPNYTRTEGFISTCRWNIQDGITISLQHIWSALALAILINRTFIVSNVPASATMRGENDFIPFTDLFDINILRQAYGASCCVSPGELDESIRNYTRMESDNYKLLRQFNGNKSQLIVHKHIRVCGTTLDFVARANLTTVYENTQPHPVLKKIIHLGIHQLYNTRTPNITLPSQKRPTIICMHLRTEPDFMYYFLRSPATYTREQILMKMNLTRNKHPTTSFAKLWSPNKNSQIKPVLYLAGGDKKDARQFFINTGWFSTVEDKNSIFINSANNEVNSFAQLLIMYHAPSSLLNSLRSDVSTVLAIIDLEICKKADVFIGNNHSSLSERIATERQRSNRWEGNATRTLENGGQYNYMVNGLAKDSDSWEDMSKLEPLHPFCAANSFLFMSYVCKYVRASIV